MPLELTAKKRASSLPVHCVFEGELDACGADARARSWAEANGFKGQAGRVLTIAGADGILAGAFFGLGSRGAAPAPLATGKLARALPAGEWHFAMPPEAADLATLGAATTR